MTLHGKKGILFLMNLKPSETLTQKQIQKGLSLVVKDGLAAEAMSTLTGGTFLVAMAILMGASNFQIGLLAALPTFTNIFQLAAIWLVQKYNNRRLVAVICNLCARFPLLIIGTLPFLFSKGTSIQVLIFLLFFHYLFGSIAGASWNSWMKDLVPQKQLGSYFSHRSRLTQILNVTLSLVLALSLDFVKTRYPQQELLAYTILFIAGGIFGMIGIYVLSRTPEPKSYLAKENLFKLFSKPLKDKNFRKLLVFNSFWSLALNLATPFFSVYMLKTIGLPLSYIIAFGILSQLSSILSIEMWGRYSDKYSNKTIITIAAPLYICCILAWTFTALFSSTLMIFGFLAGIHILTGMATAGINLAINNIGIKLATKEEAIVYISARNMIVAFVSALGPVIGGLLIDFFANRNLAWNIEWAGPKGNITFQLLHLNSWNFLFVIGGLCAMLSLRLLKKVNEEGETQKDLAVIEMKNDFRNKFRQRTSKEALLSLATFPVTFPLVLKKRMVTKIEKRATIMRRMHNIAALRKRA